MKKEIYKGLMIWEKALRRYVIFTDVTPKQTTTANCGTFTGVFHRQNKRRLIIVKVYKRIVKASALVSFRSVQVILHMALYLNVWGGHILQS